jgi:RHS repeat-associated protein
MNRLTNQVWKAGNTALASFAYTLGPTGNRTALAETVSGAARTYNWAYDYLYRLTGETLGGVTSGTVTYGYDAVGNRTNRTVTNLSISSLTNQTPTFTVNDWLTTDGYDNNGNTTNSATIAYQYDPLNHLTNANTGAISIAYDGDGNRVKKTVSTTGVTTYYLVDDRNPSGYAQVLEEWTAAGGATNLSRVYNYGLSLISQRMPGSCTNYFICDGHGSTRMLTDIGGNVVNTFAYDAYGNLIASNSVPQTAYLYCCQQLDSDLGLYYNRARYLNPNTGRFWTLDTDQGNNHDPLSLHKYLYVWDNPPNHVGPSGHSLEDITLTMFIQTSMFAARMAPVVTAARYAAAAVFVVGMTLDQQFRDNAVAMGPDVLLSTAGEVTAVLYELRGMYLSEQVIQIAAPQAAKLGDTLLKGVDDEMLVHFAPASAVKSINQDGLKHVDGGVGTEWRLDKDSHDLAGFCVDLALR